MKRIFLFSLISTTLLASLSPSMSIPRDASRRFLTDGIFDGGKSVRANLEGLRFSKHPNQGFERWVFDFSDATTKTLGSVAPQFQVRYRKAIKVEQNDGSLSIVDPARIIISLKGVSRNHISSAELVRLARKSNLVREIIAYPPIEDGDIAIEMILNDSFPFYPHQPMVNEGRLVIDLSKNS